MKRILSMMLFLPLPMLLRAEIVSQPVVNLYLEPKEDTEIDSQAIYGSHVDVLERLDSGWVKIKTLDNVIGWVQDSKIADNPDFETSAHLHSTKSLFTHIYRTNDTTPFPPLLTLPYGSKVKFMDPADTGERWRIIELISKEKAWIQRGDVEFSPQLKTLEEVLSFSLTFLGLPYTWGGTSSYGFDCSGFVQMLFREMSVFLPRNSRDQAASDLLAPVSREDIQRGDLLFFGKTRITHVGLYLGEGKFIHSGVTERPMVMISTLNDDLYPYQTARRLIQKQDQEEPTQP